MHWYLKIIHKKLSTKLTIFSTLSFLIQAIFAEINHIKNQPIKFLIIMKKNYLLLIAIFTFAIVSIGNSAVTPYLPSLQNFGGTTVDLATFFPVSADYTLEVQGTAGTPISVANGVYTYTPVATGLIRFSQKKGKVYVYEGNVYITTLIPNVIQATYPDIYANANNVTEQTGIYDVANLIVNPGFETTTGPNLNTEADKRYAASNWTPMGGHTSFTSSGVRVNVDNASYITGREGLATLLWRNDGAGVNTTSTYFYQSLGSKLKPNAAYKIKFHVLTHNQNKTCNWRVGVGSTSGGYEYSLNLFKPVSTNFTTQTFEYTFITPSVTASETFFTIGNAGDATSSTWTLIHLDRITMVEGTVSKGLTGVSSASFIEGTAYAPENVSVNFEAGDYYDMTSLIANQSFEDLQLDKQQTIPGWTKTGTGNSEYCTRNDAGPAAFKTGNVYFQYWNSAKPDFSISQTISGLPNGKYRLVAAAGGDAGTTGTYVYAGDVQTHVTSTGDHTVDAVVVNGTLTIGFKSVSRTVNWAFADNFRLYYLGEVQDPVLSVSETNITLSENVKTKTFVVTGLNLTSDIDIDATVGSGLSLSHESIVKNAAGIATGIEVTVSYNPLLVSEAIVDGSISVVSGDITKTITVKGFKNPTPTNLLGLAMGNGHTGEGSEPATFGWAYSGTAVWSTATGDNYFNRFRDGLYASRVLTFNRNTAVLSFPVVLEAGKSYKFSCNTSHINAGPFNSTFAFNSLANATGDVLASNTQSVARWNGVETLAKISFGFTPQNAGTYYMVWTTDNSTERTVVGDLMLQEAFVVSFNTNGGNDIDAQYVVSGDKVTAPATPVKGTNNFLGWYSDAELSTAWNMESNLVTANITLYAKWDTGTGLNAVNDELISTEFYTLQGQKLENPIENGIYLVKKTYASQKTEIIKIVSRNRQK